MSGSAYETVRGKRGILAGFREKGRLALALSVSPAPAFIGKDCTVCHNGINVGGRCVRIALSPEGGALKRRAGRIPDQMRCRIALPPPALEALREQLFAMIAAIDPTGDT
ncbi:MAG: hypothetical protein EPN49_12110 [Rhodanobacter sp.]|nr:MAG: hypothetical protein EPN49_12110 [Rhodanobacter sp.]